MQNYIKVEHVCRIQVQNKKAGQVTPGQLGFFFYEDIHHKHHWRVAGVIKIHILSFLGLAGLLLLVFAFPL